MNGIFIREVGIKNFKCFSDHNVRLVQPDGTTPGSGLNVLIGENGNGKTALLEAINYTNQSSYAAENRLSINDFHDHKKPILITALTSDFTCKMPELYRGCTFESDGMSSGDTIHNYHIIWVLVFAWGLSGQVSSVKGHAKAIGP